VRARPGSAAVPVPKQHASRHSPVPQPQPQPQQQQQQQQQQQNARPRSMSAATGGSLLRARRSTRQGSASSFASAVGSQGSSASSGTTGTQTTGSCNRVRSVTADDIGSVSSFASDPALLQYDDRPIRSSGRYSLEDMTLQAQTPPLPQHARAGSSASTSSSASGALAMAAAATRRAQQLEHRAAVLRHQTRLNSGVGSDTGGGGGVSSVRSGSGSYSDDFESDIGEELENEDKALSFDGSDSDDSDTGSRIATGGAARDAGAAFPPRPLPHATSAVADADARDAEMVLAEVKRRALEAAAATKNPRLAHRRSSSYSSSTDGSPAPRYWTASARPVGTQQGAQQGAQQSAQQSARKPPPPQQPQPQPQGPNWRMVADKHKRRLRAQLGDEAFDLVYAFLRAARASGNDNSAKENQRALRQFVDKDKLDLAFEVDQLLFIEEEHCR
jgi:hypothetical protein